MKVRRGQTLTTDSVGSNYITVSIKPPRGARYEADLAANCNNEHRVRPTAPGDYIITVTECRRPTAGVVDFACALASARQKPTKVIKLSVLLPPTE